MTTLETILDAIRKALLGNSDGMQAEAALLGRLGK